MSIKTTLVEQFNSQIKEIGRLEVGSEKQKIATECATKLADRIIEIDKMETQKELEVSKREIEANLKIEELRIDRKDKTIRNVIAIASLGFAVGTAIVTTKFELSGGMHTTEAGKGSIRKLLSFKI